MALLAEALKKNLDEINEYLYVGSADWDRLIEGVEDQERAGSDDFDDEQVWTFLVGSAYAMGAEQGVATLSALLTGSPQLPPGRPKIWFEVLPIPPRGDEGNTHLDLALGTIALREGAKTGIELDDAECPWVCFCEMKWYSDISTGVENDPHRNQLARVIENALCFQGGGRYADNVHVTLVTPRIFRHEEPKSRLYQYKFDDYSVPTQLIEDLEACALEPRNQPDWCYPSDLAKRTENLSLHWTTYDELFENIPDCPLAPELKSFWRQYGNYQGR